MAVRTRVEPIDRRFELAIRQDEDPKARAAALAGFARQALAEAQEINRRSMGRVPTHETYVDDRLGAPLESVRPDGRIVFEFDLINDLFEWIGEMLVQNSPVLTGEYQDSHLFYADGVEIAPGAVVPPADEYVFLSALPYARKIEGGLSDQAPDGVYHAVAVMARARFSNIARINFGWRSPLMAYQRGSANRVERAAMKTQPARRAAMAMERETRVPAIIITLE